MVCVMFREVSDLWYGLCAVHVWQSWLHGCENTPICAIVCVACAAGQCKGYIQLPLDTLLMLLHGEITQYPLKWILKMKLTYSKLDLKSWCFCILLLQITCILHMIQINQAGLLWRHKISLNITLGRKLYFIATPNSFSLKII